MKFCLTLLLLLFLQADAFFTSKKKNKCPKYDTFEKESIACLLQYEADFESKDLRTRCDAYRESTRCMPRLAKQRQDCGLTAPGDVYNSFTSWEQLQKSGSCGGRLSSRSYIRRMLEDLLAADEYNN